MFFPCAPTATRPIALFLRCSSHLGDSRPFSCFIHSYIRGGRGLPGEVLGHTVGHYRLPELWIPVGFQRGLDAFEKRLSGVLLELEARPLLRFGVEILDRVVQTAGGADDGHR